MLDVMYEIARKKAGDLKDRIQGFETITAPPGVWQEKHFRDIPLVVAGVDGSMNILPFQDIALYAVSSTAVVDTGNGLDTRGYGDVNVMPLHPFIRDRVRIQMLTYELKAGLSALNSDYLLLDGSFLGYLVRPAAFETAPPQGVKEEIIKTYFPQIQGQDFTQPLLAADRFRDEIAQRYPEQSFEVQTFLEYLEYLAVLAHLLEHGNIASISKTSNSHNIFRGVLPDIAILELTSRQEGQTRVFPVKLDSELKRGFPVLDGFFKNLEFNLVYVRLEDGGPILRVETPSHEVEELLGAVKHGCVEGYPFILKKAHQDVVIKDRDIEAIWNSLGEFREPRRRMLVS